ncbi:amidase [Oceanibacterium hippocampi]|uniref:Acylamidase n=1 Tax=Oceanibacterium hippocampi TaxID=745714 RepID=A0A1Y5T159_9PROT|nr:amidase [Oceanibacterium hippocampi]SLN53254.1 Acylamidase [Oceanibacterium hippocampi]
MSDDLIYMPASELVRGYAAGTVSPVEVTNAVLARIDEQNGPLNAFILVDHDGALEAARESEARWRAGTPLGPIDGVPTTIKDIILTKGWPTLRGSTTVDPDQPWDIDAPCTARLREAGAVLLGKTTSPEFGWKGVTDSPLTGITRNPWHLDKTPGGSSGGAAAACAAGMGALHIGTDGGGSIRIPASFSGIFGFKQTFGVVPAYPASPFGTVAHVGPMARTVADAALMLRVIAQPDSRDWFAVPHDETPLAADLGQGVAGLRIAYSANLGYAAVEPEVAACVAQAARVFADLGAHVEAVDPGFEDPHGIFQCHWYAGAYGALGHLDEAGRGRLDPGLDRAVEAGSRIALDTYLAAVQARNRLGVRMAAFHREYDLLITPATAVAAFDVGRLAPDDANGDWMSWTPFSFPFNLTQQPACSVPCGFTSGGLPVGLQIVGDRFADALVLRAALAFEMARPVHRSRPAL